MQPLVFAVPRRCRHQAGHRSVDSSRTIAPSSVGRLHSALSQPSGAVSAAREKHQDEHVV